MLTAMLPEVIPMTVPVKSSFSHFPPSLFISPSPLPPSPPLSMPPERSARLGEPDGRAGTLEARYSISGARRQLTLLHPLGNLCLRYCRLQRFFFYFYLSYM